MIKTIKEIKLYAIIFGTIFGILFSVIIINTVMQKLNPPESLERELSNHKDDRNLAMYEYRCALGRVVDGDTVDLVIDLGFHISIRERFRLDGINAPEVRGKEKEEGIEAKKFLMELLYKIDNIPLSKQLIVRTKKDKKGKYGRWIGKIGYYDNSNWIDIQEIMVKENHAVWKEY